MRRRAARRVGGPERRGPRNFAPHAKKSLAEAGHAAERAPKTGAAAERAGGIRRRRAFPARHLLHLPATTASTRSSPPVVTRSPAPPLPRRKVVTRSPAPPVVPTARRRARKVIPAGAPPAHPQGQSPPLLLRLPPPLVLLPCSSSSSLPCSSPVRLL